MQDYVEHQNNSGYPKTLINAVPGAGVSHDGTFSTFLYSCNPNCMYNVSMYRHEQRCNVVNYVVNDI